jgi:hypothetical protein
VEGVKLLVGDKSLAGKKFVTAGESAGWKKVCDGWGKVCDGRKKFVTGEKSL